MTIARAARLLAALALILLIACGKEDRAAGGVAWRPVSPPPPPAKAHERFTVRGRLERPESISWRYDDAGSPFPSADIQTTLDRATAAWNRVGPIHFQPASLTPGEPADLVIGWRCLSEGTCPPFAGLGGELAHTGPMHLPTFVHFNANARFGSDDRAKARLLTTALHELGHVLGLDHSADGNSLLYAEYQKDLEAPTASDADGLFSLYGGGRDSDADLAILRFGPDAALTPCAPPVRGVAPAASVRWQILDTNGDEADEILCWPTDDRAAGNIVVYRFTEGPRLRASDGPLEGLTGKGRRTYFSREAQGAVVMLNVSPNLRYAASVFDGVGLPAETWPENQPLDLPGLGVDADGDRRFDAPLPPESAPAGSAGSSGRTVVVGLGKLPGAWSLELGPADATGRRKIYAVKGTVPPVEQELGSCHAAALADLDGDQMPELVVSGFRR